MEMEEAEYYSSDVEMEDAPEATASPCALGRVGLKKLAKRKRSFKPRAESKVLKDARMGKCSAYS